MGFTSKPDQEPIKALVELHSGIDIDSVDGAHWILCKHVQSAGVNVGNKNLDY